MNVAAFITTLLLGVVLGFPQSIKHESNDGLITLKTAKESDNVGIYGGNSTTMNTHRYLVSILVSGTFRCAGVIVSTSWIVSLADCTYGENITDVTVVASSTDGITGTSYSVLQAVLHPDYVYGSLDYDFACIQISGTFYYAAKREHQLPSAEPADNSVFSVAGYGCTSVSCETRALAQASMVWLPKETCNSTFYKYVKVGWTRLGCAYNPAGATLCKGDFGDPIVKGTVFYGMFASALSTGFCSSKAYPIIVTDVYPVADWVRNVSGAT